MKYIPEDLQSAQKMCGHTNLLKKTIVHFKFHNAFDVLNLRFLSCNLVAFILMLKTLHERVVCRESEVGKSDSPLYLTLAFSNNVNDQIPSLKNPNTRLLSQVCVSAHNIVVSLS